MEILDILFVVIGLVCVAASFFLPEKLLGGAKKEEQRAADLKEAVLAELRKKENLDRIVADALSEISERMQEQKNELLLDSEAELDRMSNEKMLAFGEYSDEVLEKINQNHMEVVFLYDMLKEKESDLKDFAAHLEGTEQQLQAMLQETKTEDDRLNGIRHQVQELLIRLEEDRRRYLRDQVEAMQRMSANQIPSGQANAKVRQRAEQFTEKGQASAVQTAVPGRRSGQGSAGANAQASTQINAGASVRAGSQTSVGTGVRTGAGASVRTDVQASASTGAQTSASAGALTRRSQRPPGSGRPVQPARTTQGKMPAQSREDSDRLWKAGQPDSENPVDAFGQDNPPDRLGSRTGLPRIEAQEEAAAAGVSVRRTQTGRPQRARKPGDMLLSEMQSQDKGNIRENPDPFGEMGLFGQEEVLSEEPVSLEEQSDRILRMYRGGMSILEISRAMGLGQGEVRLVLDLFHRVK